MADLFDWIGALWTKKELEGTPPVYVMHRFLASEKVFAPVARALQQRVRDPRIVVKVWQGLLPKGRGSPRLIYPAPKKRPAEEVLVAALKEHEGYSRAEAEQAASMLFQLGKEAEALRHYGVEPDGKET